MVWNPTELLEKDEAKRPLGGRREQARVSTRRRAFCAYERGVSGPLHKYTIGLSNQRPLKLGLDLKLLLGSKYQFEVVLGQFRYYNQ